MQLLGVLSGCYGVALNCRPTKIHAMTTHPSCRSIDSVSKTKQHIHSLFTDYLVHTKLASPPVSV